VSDTPISGLTAVTTVALTDEFPINQGGTTKKVTRAQMLDTERYMLRADATRNLTSQTARQALFASGASTLTLPTGTYRFDLLFRLSGMSATTGNLQLDLLGAGTATAAAWMWAAQGLDNSTPATAAALSGGFHVAATSASVVATTATGTGLGVHAYGTFEITSAGTFIPSVLLTTAAAATVAVGSNFWAERISTSTTLTGLGPTS
jgi:hypothetical protein